MDSVFKKTMAVFSVTIATIALALSLAPQAFADDLVAAQADGATSTYALLRSDGYLVPCDSSGSEISDTWDGQQLSPIQWNTQTVYIAADVGKITGSFRFKFTESWSGRLEYSASFSDITKLGQVIFLPNSKCTDISYRAFRYSSLASIHLPDTVMSIGDAAFEHCASLYEISFGNSLRSIGTSAFSGCSSLTEIELPASFSTISTYYNQPVSTYGSFSQSGIRKVVFHSVMPISDGSDGKSIWHAFVGTPIMQAGNNANIYVPTSALTTYRSHYGVGGSDGDGWSYFNQSHLDKLRGIDGEPTSINDASMTVSQTAYTYNGNAKTPSVSVSLGGKTLAKDTDYTVAYTNNINAGTASVTATGIGMYAGNVTKTFKINQAAQPMKVTPKTAVVAKSSTTKTLARSKVLAVSKAKGKVTYKKLSGNKKITVNTKNGNVTVKGGLAKKAYSVKVRVKATNKAGSNYKTGCKDVTFKVVVK
ncbi:MAG: leucine-rich repeat protein [Eggerthellaceae bacterium]|nr:leucine-rich repeat protein [Eggerthellaceae bacterium]